MDQDQSIHPTQDIVFTYQGSFAPPHLGHYEAAKNFIEEIALTYPNTQVLFLFMPSSNKSSKASTSVYTALSNPGDYISQEDRLKLLGFYAQELNKLYPNIKVQVSDLEYRICVGEFNFIGLPSPNYLSSTINTLTVLAYLYPGSTIGLGLGIDNGYDISTWNLIDKYLLILGFILICDREPSGQFPIINLGSRSLSVNIKSIKTENQIIKAFGLNSQSYPTSPSMYFKSPNPEDIETLKKLGGLITILNSPVGFSSSEIRKIFNSLYSIDCLNLTEVRSLLEKMCGFKSNVDYICSKNIFNPYK